MATSRRDFIRISALGSAGLIWGSHWLKAGSSPGPGKALSDRWFSPRDLAITPTYCEICFWKCAGWVHKDEKGEIRKIAGNVKDPNCNGRFCPRGTGGVGQYSDEDRLKTPLIRIDERGKQVFREATWDEALDYIAEKMKKIAAEHGPESTALFTHGSGGKYFTRLLNGFGSSNVAAPSYAQWLSHGAV